MFVVFLLLLVDFMLEEGQVRVGTEGEESQTVAVATIGNIIVCAIIMCFIIGCAIIV